MALINCFECDNKVSSVANSCPKCGAPIANANNTHTVGKIRVSHKSQTGSAGNILAAICSFFIPGLGQLFQGNIFAAIIYFVLIPIVWFFSIYTLGILALILHIYSAAHAAFSTKTYTHAAFSTKKYSRMTDEYYKKQILLLKHKKQKNKP